MDNILGHKKLKSWTKIMGWKEEFEASSEQGSKLFVCSSYNFNSTVEEGVCYNNDTVSLDDKAPILIVIPGLTSDSASAVSSFHFLYPLWYVRRIIVIYVCAAHWHQTILYHMEVDSSQCKLFCFVYTLHHSKSSGLKSSYCFMFDDLFFLVNAKRLETFSVENNVLIVDIDMDCKNYKEWIQL